MAAEAQRAEANLRRIRILSDRGFASSQALETALAQERSARAALMAAEAKMSVRHSEVAAAQAALIGPDSRLGPFSISVTAPATGRITRVLQESARYVSAGTALIEVSDQAGLEAAIEFLSQDAVRISEGMAAQVYDWGGAAPIAAVVRRIEPQGFTKVSALGVEEQRVLVMLQLNGDPRSWSSLGPGYRLWGRVFLRRRERVTTVPIGALVRIDGRWAVFKIRKGRTYRTFVDIGILTDQKAEVRTGLRPGDRVVLYPSDRVTDQGRVRLRG
jgi:HlyD family secretion protein